MKVPTTRGKRVTVLTYDGGTCIAPALVLSNDGKRASLLIHKSSGFVTESVSAKSDYVGRPERGTLEQAFRELAAELARIDHTEQSDMLSDGAIQQVSSAIDAMGSELERRQKARKARGTE